MRKFCYFIAAVGAVLTMACNQNLKVSDSPESEIILADSLKLLTKFPAKVDESSGLCMSDGVLWTHNDSGDDPVLYQVSTQMPDLIQSVEIENAQSRDWEELAMDSAYIYIGDFGNNRGNRRDLTIYKVPKASLKQQRTQAVTAESIEFQYPDQSNFAARPYQHNFDCEAMIAVGDSLYLFSKNHQDKRCRLYALPKDPGKYTAVLKSEMDTRGTITAADIDAEGQVVALLGYNVYQEFGQFRNKPFVWLLSDFPETRFFEGKSFRVDFPKERQTEGICFGVNGGLIISSEGERGGSGGLFFWDFKKWLK